MSRAAVKQGSAEPSAGRVRAAEQGPAAAGAPGAARGKAPQCALTEVVARTQQQLGKVIATPVLTTALLRRPFFRFLHDIFSAVTLATRFADGLFDGDELQGPGLDKEGKVAYIAKLLDHVQAALGAQLVVQPLKVVCGLEPEHTNTFLQALALASARHKDNLRRALASMDKRAGRPEGGWAQGGRDKATPPAKPPGSAPGKAPLTSLNDLVAKTQKELGAVIKNPPLTATLLRRPPFRFIHDIISSVTLTTGFGKDLFSGDELIAAKLSTQDAKTEYIAKAVAAVEKAHPLKTLASKFHDTRKMPAEHLQTWRSKEIYECGDTEASEMLVPLVAEAILGKAVKVEPPAGDKTFKDKMAWTRDQVHALRRLLHRRRLAVNDVRVWPLA